MQQQLEALDPQKVYRLFNLGATTLISAAHEGREDVMPATWVCPVNYDRVTAVVDASHYTRRLIEQSGYFGVSLPCRAIARETLFLGSVSMNDDARKLQASGATFIKMPGSDIPFVEGSIAYAIFRVVSEPHNEKVHDLFIGECVSAWADTRVFSQGHWHFDNQPDELRTLHYVAGGHFLTIGQAHDIEL